MVTYDSTGRPSSGRHRVRPGTVALVALDVVLGAVALGVGATVLALSRGVSGLVALGVLLLLYGALTTLELVVRRRRS